MNFPHSFKRFAGQLSHVCHEIHEAERDIEAAIRNPDAMSKPQRMKNEFKAFGGLASSVAGCLELNPVAALCGIGTAVEGLYALEQAGKKHRGTHPEYRTP